MKSTTSISFHLHLQLLLFFCIFSLQLEEVLSCTTLVLGRKTTKDGSVLAAHTNDGDGRTDPRFISIPKDAYKPTIDKNGIRWRPVYYTSEEYPRYVGTARGNIPEYDPSSCQEGSSRCADYVPIGYIPDVEERYNYYEATYGIMNEYQVGLAESTCSGVFTGKPQGMMGGKALLSIDQLSQIAMERSKTAREAIEVMGSLSQKYGFYGESASFEGGAESLIVTDPMEAWIFHILADDTGTSSIWVAARVPETHVAAVPNIFVIREVDLSDKKNFLGRSDMWEIAEKNNLWNPNMPKDFAVTFSDGEYAHKYYSGRRQWRVFDLFASNANLSPYYSNIKYDKPYPMSVEVDSDILGDLSAQSVFSALRDWYNNTAFSVTTGLASGPFNTPDRYSGGSGESQVKGNWERTITLFRSSDTYVVESNINFPSNLGGIIHVGPQAAHYTCYVPIFSNLTTSFSPLSYGWQGIYNTSTLFWLTRNIGNVAQIKFDYMIQDIQALQNKLETQSKILTDHIQTSFSSSVASTLSKEDVIDLLKDNLNTIMEEYRNLMHTLLFKYADGYINEWKGNTAEELKSKPIESDRKINVNSFEKTDELKTLDLDIYGNFLEAEKRDKKKSERKEVDQIDRRFTSSSTGYPSWWLEIVGYPDGPPPVSK